MSEVQQGPYIRKSNPSGKQVFGYFSNGFSSRVDSRFARLTLKDARVITPELTFKVSREQALHQFAINDLEDSSNQTTFQEALESMRVASVKLPFAPYCIFEATIEETLFGTDFKLKEVVEEVRNEQKLIRAFVEPVDSGGPSGSFLFDPENSWVLLEYTWGAKDPEKGAQLKCSIEYDEKSETLPVISKAEYWRVDNGVKTEMFTSTLLDVRLDKAPQDLFTLTAFGLSDQLEAKEQPVSGMSLRSWLLVAGNIVLIVLLVLVYFSRKLSRNQLG